MNAALCRLIDRATLEMAAARMPRPDGRDPHFDEAKQLLEGSSFAQPVASAQPLFEGEKKFRFDTPRPTPWPNNNVVWGRFYRATGRWQERPAVLLLHGWNDAITHFLRFPALARRLARMGVNAVVLTAPYHFRRWPKGLGLWGNFLCPDLRRTAEAAAQAVAENRAMAGWLLEQGCPKVGVWGISLGGWLAALTVRHDPRFSCAVMVAPVCRLDRLLDEAAFCRAIRAALNGRRLDNKNFNLACAPAPLPRENILLVEAKYDLFVPPDTVEELWQAWGQPEIWRLPHGHISVLGAPGLGGRIARWVAWRLSEPGGK